MVPSPDAGSARILVVDDEVEVAAVLEELIAGLGHQVTVAHNGRDAVRLLAELRPEMVFTDINMPGTSGIEVLRVAKELDPKPAVVVVTGHASTATAIDALRQGAFDYITKPFAFDQVEQIVERGLANRRLEETNRRLVAELSDKNAILERHEHELRERVRRATTQLQRLYDLGREIGYNLELAPRLSMICARSAELCHAQAAVVYLANEESGECRAAAWHGIGGLEPDRGALPVVPPDGVLAPTLAEHLRLIDQLYPQLRVDFVAVKGSFGPELVEALSRRFRIPKNHMFIGTPGDRFPHRIEDLGGVRVVL